MSWRPWVGEPAHRPGTDEGALAWQIAKSTAEGRCCRCRQLTDRRWEFRAEVSSERVAPLWDGFPSDPIQYKRVAYACCGRDACSELLIRAEAQRALPHQHPTYWP